MYVLGERIREEQIYVNKRIRLLHSPDTRCAASYSQPLLAPLCQVEAASVALGFKQLLVLGRLWSGI